MILSPRGEVLAEAKGSDDIALAGIDPREGRRGQDELNEQADMRARLFRERSPAAYAILTDPSPPVLAKVPAAIGVEDAVRIGGGTLTVGEERFKEAEALLRAKKLEEARAAFEALRKEYPGTWIDRVSQERLRRIAGRH